MVECNTTSEDDFNDVSGLASVAKFEAQETAASGRIWTGGRVDEGLVEIKDESLGEVKGSDARDWGKTGRGRGREGTGVGRSVTRMGTLGRAARGQEGGGERIWE